jgi:hypothetical protein
VNIYGDALTSNNKASFLSEVEKGGITYWDLFIDSKPYRMSTRSAITNEAEFIVTYPKAVKVELNKEAFLHHIVKKQEEALLEVRKHLEKGKQSKITGLVGYVNDSKRGRNIKVPYETLGLIGTGESARKYYVGYKVGETLRGLKFYVQCTIGIQLEYVVWALSIFADLYSEMKVQNILEKDEIKKWKMVVEDCNQFNLSHYLYSILVLVAYSFVSKGNRKASPFIVRHLFSEILLTLSHEEHVQIHNCLKTLDYKDGNGVTFDKYYLNLMINGSYYARDTQKSYENMDIVKTFEYVPKGVNSIVLVEIRYFNRLLNHIKRGKRVKGDDANDYIPLF